MADYGAPEAAQNLGYEVYADFIEKAMLAQEARKSSIEQRGIAVITTSGTLVTLLFAVIGLATKRTQTYSLPADTRSWLIAAVVLLVLAAALGLASNVPLMYSNVMAPQLRIAVNQFWREDAWAASGRVARTRLDIIERASKVNRLKVYALFVAVVFEATALVPLAVAVVQITE